MARVRRAGKLWSMAQDAACALPARRRQVPRGRRGRAAARKRAHVRDREAQRAQARRRLRNPYYYIAERIEAGHHASSMPRVPRVAQPFRRNFREVQNAVRPPHAWLPRAGIGEKRRHLRRPQ